MIDDKGVRGKVGRESGEVLGQGEKREVWEYR